jgi:LysR family nod box-dependent transcriptional activator
MIAIAIPQVRSPTMANPAVTQGQLMSAASKRKLRHINLNLIPVLAELLYCKNVTHAASKLHLTQSAVSASLKRLREIFDDELLVMRGREMVLTDKAEKLIPVLEQLLNSVESVFNEQLFDPATSTRRFRIVTADYVSALLISDIGHSLVATAPGVSLHVSQGTGETAKEIQMGFVDMLIAPEYLNPPDPLENSHRESDFRHEIFFRDQLVAIESSANPPRNEPISLADYLKRPHCSFHLYHDTHESVEQATLADLNLVQNDKFIVPYFTLLPRLVTTVKDAIAVIPASLARTYAEQLPIRMFRPPIDFPEHNLIMVWARSLDRDPAICWLRDTIRLAGQHVEKSAECALS